MVQRHLSFWSPDQEAPAPPAPPPGLAGGFEGRPRPAGYRCQICGDVLEVEGGPTPQGPTSGASADQTKAPISRAISSASARTITSASRERWAVSDMRLARPASDVVEIGRAFLVSLAASLVVIPGGARSRYTGS
jgi:hypothetical protein